MSVVEVRNPDRSAEGATFLEKAVAVARLDSPGRRVDDCVLVELLVGVERLIPY